MKQLNLAGNIVYFKKIDEDSLLPYKLRVSAYEEFDKIYDLSSDTNLFKTPVDFNNPDSGPGYQYVFNSKEFNNYVQYIINQELESDMKVVESWCLHQTSDSWINNPAHTHMTADWICVMYLDIREGDAIQFFDAAGNMEEYSPDFGEVIFFPSSALHRPKENTGSKRLTLNAELKQEMSIEHGELVKNRFEICKGCDLYTVDNQECSECGCYVPMKIGLDDESCPLAKW